MVIGVLDLHRQQAARRRTAVYGMGQSPKIGCNMYVANVKATTACDAGLMIKVITQRVRKAGKDPKDSRI